MSVLALRQLFYKFAMFSLIIRLHLEVFLWFTAEVNFASFHSINLHAHLKGHSWDRSSKGPGTNCEFYLAHSQCSHLSPIAASSVINVTANRTPHASFVVAKVSLDLCFSWENSINAVYQVLFSSFHSSQSTLCFFFKLT